MATYIVEMNINGEWKVWQRYTENCNTMSAKERAEMGMKIASNYGECRIVKMS